MEGTTTYFLEGKDNTELTIENARLMSLNFSGREKIHPTTGRVVNNLGERNFCVYIDDIKLVERMLESGWNLKPNINGTNADEVRYYLPVAVRYTPMPPKVYIINGMRKREIGEEQVKDLDKVVFNNVDLQIHGRIWQPGSIKAYLRVGYFEISSGNFVKSRLDDKYASYNSDNDELPFDV